MKTVLLLATWWLAFLAPTALASQYQEHPRWDMPFSPNTTPREGVWAHRSDLGSVAYIRLTDRDRDWPQAEVEIEVFENGDVALTRRCESRRRGPRDEISLLNAMGGQAVWQDCDGGYEQLPRDELIEELLLLLENVNPPPLGVDRHLIRLKAEVGYQEPGY